VHRYNIVAVQQAAGTLSQPPPVIPRRDHGIDEAVALGGKPAKRKEIRASCRARELSMTSFPGMLCLAGGALSTAGIENIDIAEAKVPAWP
jgi:hypothetical protein